MKNIFSVLATAALICLTALVAHADDDRFEIGIGAGPTLPAAGEAFKSSATKGDAQSYWLGYSLDDAWAIELGFDHFDFDGISSDHQMIGVSGFYRFYADQWLHPIAKLGIGSVRSEINSLGTPATNSFGGKAVVGLEADTKYVSVGALANYFFVSKIGDAASHKDVQAFVPMVFLTIHNALDEEEKSEPVAPMAQIEPVTVKKDSDQDGVADEDDKCSNTPMGTVVNQYGCSEKEKASIKLNVEFALGKAIVEEKYQSEIDSLANFMKKFPQTQVEVGGYTDSQGSVAKNTTLSQKRAESVKAALVKAGIEESRLTAKGYGPANPVADNATAVGRAQNRRVLAEVSVMTDKKK